MKEGAAVIECVNLLTMISYQEETGDKSIASRSIYVVIETLLVCEKADKLSLEAYFSWHKILLISLKISLRIHSLQEKPQVLKNPLMSAEFKYMKPVSSEKISHGKLVGKYFPILTLF